MVYARVKRTLGRDCIVIVDGMNYIKGWRYQLWCESKAAGTTCTVVGLTLYLLGIYLPSVFVQRIRCTGKRGLYSSFWNENRS